MKGPVRAYSRLAVVMAAVVWMSMFACRPAWSPDGKQLLFAGTDQNGKFVGLWDRQTETARRLLSFPADHHYLNALWTPEGDSIITLSCPRKSDVVTVTMSDADGNLTGTMQYGRGTRSAHALVGCVPHGKHLFFTTNTIGRLDLSTGSVAEVEPGPGETYGVGRRGDGLCYARVTEKDRSVTAWEIGSLDPETMARTPILKSGDFPGLEVTPTPAFSPDLGRIAMPTKDKHAILVFAGGKLAQTLAIGKRQVVSDLTWSKDGKKVYAAQGDDQGTDQVWNLLEVDVDSGQLVRTRLFQCERWRFGSPVDASLGVALSPDGALVAVTTAYAKGVAAKAQGLYLVDLTRKERKATCVPFPPSEKIVVCGSDLMLGLGKQWREDYRKEPVDRVVEIRGGGTSHGFASLASGKCELSMAARRPRERDLDFAKKHGVTFEGQCIAREPLAVCVHKDNPLASLTLAELTNIFGQGSVDKWSDLGVELEHGPRHVVAGFAAGYRNAHHNFRTKVLRRQKLDDSVRFMAKAEDAIKMLLQEPNAIVCMDHPELARAEKNVRIVPIRKDEDSPPLWPEGGSIDSGTYPLLSEFFVYSRKDAAPGVKRFMQWLASRDGRKSIDRAGYTPAK